MPSTASAAKPVPATPVAGADPIHDPAIPFGPREDLLA
jgi:hypothetical protein